METSSRHTWHKQGPRTLFSSQAIHKWECTLTNSVLFTGWSCPKMSHLPVTWLPSHWDLPCCMQPAPPGLPATFLGAQYLASLPPIAILYPSSLLLLDSPVSLCYTSSGVQHRPMLPVGPHKPHPDLCFLFSVTPASPHESVFQLPCPNSIPEPSLI